MKTKKLKEETPSEGYMTVPSPKFKIGDVVKWKHSKTSKSFKIIIRHYNPEDGNWMYEGRELNCEAVESAIELATNNLETDK